MKEIQHLAKLAYQNGEKAMQKGWWPYVEEKAERLGIKAEVLTEIERQKSLNVLKKGGAYEGSSVGS